MKINELTDRRSDDDEKKEYFASLFKFYLDSKEKIHIVLTNERFYNGYVIKIENDRILFDDSNLGKMPIFFQQIKLVEKYRTRMKNLK
jgi:hypothetical protein